MKELKDNNRIEDLFICLVGNKIDLEDKRTISTEEGKKYADNNNIHFFEVSAKISKGIEDLFNKVIKGALEKIVVSNEKEDGEDKLRLSSFTEPKEFKEKHNICC